MPGPALYIDEDSSDRAMVSALRSAGCDVLTANEAGMTERLDSEHLAFATEQRRILVTQNIRDFRVLHRQLMESGRHHRGIVLIHQSDKLGPGEVTRRVLRLSQTLGNGDLTDRAEFL